jgi:hypothetical protein
MTTHKNLTEQIRAIEPTIEAEPEDNDIFEHCLVCDSNVILKLRADWQDILRDTDAVIDIVGCGNPWHYATHSLSDEQ